MSDLQKLSDKLDKVAEKLDKVDESKKEASVAQLSDDTDTEPEIEEEKKLEIKEK